MKEEFHTRIACIRRKPINLILGGILRTTVPDKILRVIIPYVNSVATSYSFSIILNPNTNPTIIALLFKSR